MPADENKAAFPLSALVGQQALKRALLIAAANPSIGSALVRGTRDAGKRTAIRGLSSILPNIKAHRGCPVRCPPGPYKPCPICSEAEKLETVNAPAPLVDISITSDMGQLAGRRVDNEPFAGLLGRANQGYAVLDRINLFSEKTLRHIFEVQEKGVVESDGDMWPAKFVILATMNDEEGELSASLVERFALCVRVSALTDIEERLEVIKRVESYRLDPERFRSHYEREEGEMRARVAEARRLMPRAELSAAMQKEMERRCSGLRGLKDSAVLRMSQAVLGNAALNGRIWGTSEDVRDVSSFVLGHLKG
ncbi:MAG: ATP-binding protein [Euryarchaeota archaeon]|nr:ATP-binding protein [Euryarchaeota archaeon]